MEVLRRHRASWSVATLYLLLLPVLLGVLPKPEATAEFLLLSDLAAPQICTMQGAGKAPGAPAQHQPDCILCSTASPFAASLAATPPADAVADPSLLRLAFALPQPMDFALPASRLHISDIQSRGPPGSRQLQIAPT